MLLKRVAESMAVSSAQAVTKSGSMATRLTLWYALLSVALIAAAASIMYSVMAEHMRQEDDQLLASRIAELRAKLELYSSDSALFQEEVKREAALMPGIDVYVRNARGETVVGMTATAIPAFDGELSPLGPVRGRDWYAPDGSVYRVMTAKVAVGEGYILQIALNRTKEEDFFAAYRQKLWIAICVILVVAVTVGYFIAHHLMRPVAKLAAMVDALGAADLHQRIGNRQWPTELQPLAANFDQLLTRLEDAFVRMSHFSANIAHELRTPLHILQGEAEVVLTRDVSVEAYRACIESAAEEYQRLAAMVDGLLFLARAEQPDAQLNRQQLKLDEEIATVCDFYQALADEQGIMLVISGTGDIMADASFLRRALGNLVANALRHTPAGGRIVINARNRHNRGVEISVSDSGEGISPDDLPHVFDRFYRADGARSRETAGSGLGLAIVKFIVELHGGAVSVHSELHHGTTVTLAFPAVPIQPD